MSSADETRQRIQKVLQPYILPREEVAYRRRVLTAHLNSCTRDGSISSPFGLVQPSQAVRTPADVRGLHREYLKALNANISAKEEYEKVRDEISRGSKSGSGGGARGVSESATSNPLEEHLVKIKLQRKQERLRTVEKHIGLLNQKPAASPTFLDPEEIFKDTRPLPDVPRDVVEGLALGETNGKANLNVLIDRVEKQVLRTKLILKAEEKLLENVKGRSTVRPETITDDAKLTALNATRTELILWMETELGKVSGEDDPDRSDDESYEGPTPPAVDIDSAHLDEQLASSKSKYTQYLSARKTLLHLVSHHPQPTILPKPPTPSETNPTPPPPPAPTTYLLTPHLTALLSLSREQKSLITQKSHLNTTIAKQITSTAKLLDHLAEESNLLPHHPAPRPGKTLFGKAETPDVSSRVKAWAYAAEEAKIATLEAVAEKIEEGQVALEGSMKAIGEVGALLGRGGGGEGEGRGGEEEEVSDIWLGEDRPGRQGGRKHVRKESRAGESKELWGFLDGSLGLLKGGDD